MFTKVELLKSQTMFARLLTLLDPEKIAQHVDEDRAEKRLRMRAVDSFWRVFDRLINESLPP